MRRCRPRSQPRGAAHVDYQCHSRDEPDVPGDRSAYAGCTVPRRQRASTSHWSTGLYRDYVTPFLLPKIRSGGMLIIDNVNRYLPSLTMPPASLRPPAAPTAGRERERRSNKDTNDLLMSTS
jgi:hypothetical protein